MMKDELAAAVKGAVEELMTDANQEPPAGLQIIIEHPVSPAHGEYSLTVAMQLAKILKKPPLFIAGEIKAKLLLHDSIRLGFSKIEVAPPGFINLYLDWAYWAAGQQVPHTSKANKAVSSKVVIEHTSINPNKSAHIGHLRNSCIGDTLARLLKKSGHQVEVHNYIDDLGNQLADTLVGIEQMISELPFDRFGDFCWDIYSKINKAYKENPGLLEERVRVLHELEKGNSNTAWMGLLVAERIVREHLEEMKQFGIHYDVLVWESSIVREGFWSKTFELLRTTPVFQQETEGKLAGCWVLKQEGGEAETGNHEDFNADKVLVRSNGILTYTAKDIAYHLWKFGVLGQDFRYKKFADRLWSTDSQGIKKRIGRADMVVNVIDHRQEYPQMMVKQALSALGFEQQARQLRHVSYGVVSLSPATAAGLGVDTSDQKHSYAMSGRQGIGIKADDFLNRMEQIITAKRSRRAGLSSRTIAAASIRYYLLRFHLQTEVVFDLEQATEVSGNTGVYLLYTYARSCSILRRAKQAPGLDENEAIPMDNLEMQEYSLLRQLAYWPETLENAVNELSPNHLCTYVHELTNLFNHFYAACPILKAEGGKRKFRLWLTERFQAVLHEGLEILGLPTPQHM
ncbi:arginine--tRNA ligase [Paenibacillus solisilvae]|uniref:Arginine--tRNA ligase n=1 Tax=Paenibacillus solisilvae TaxID=2486751 RepID=A0ABW0VWG3_9BACL